MDSNAVQQDHPHLRAREQHLLSAILAPFDIFLLDHRVVDVYGKLRAALENSGTGIGALDLHCGPGAKLGGHSGYEQRKRVHASARVAGRRLEMTVVAAMIAHGVPSKTQRCLRL